jgi:hypothetical protein
LEETKETKVILRGEAEEGPVPLAHATEAAEATESDATEATEDPETWPWSAGSTATPRIPG